MLLTRLEEGKKVAKMKARKGNMKSSPQPVALVSNYGDHIFNFDDDMPVSYFPNSWGTFENAGGELLATSYFESTYGNAGKFFISWNNGIARFLMPSTMPGFSAALRETRTAKEGIIHPFQVSGRTFLWLSFDDGSPNPYCLWMSGEMMDRNIPTKQDFKFKFALYTDNGKIFEVPGKMTPSIQGRYRMDIFNLKDTIAHNPEFRIRGEESREFSVFELAVKNQKISSSTIVDLQKFCLSDGAVMQVIAMMDKLRDEQEWAHEKKHFMNLPFSKIWLEYSYNEQKFGALLETQSTSTHFLLHLFATEQSDILMSSAIIKPSEKLESLIECDQPKKSGHLPQEVAVAHGSFVLSFLVLLNEKTYIEQETTRTVRSTHHVSEYKITDITFKIPREIIIRQNTLASQNNGGRVRRMQHEVMGSWHHNRKKGLNCTNHEFEAEEGSDRRKRCKHCNMLTWYVRPHQRGNAEAGIMAKDRFVHG